MIKNYFKTTFRNFQRNLGYTSINVLGLTVGLTTSILILLWVMDETSYDRFHTNSKNLYKLLHNSHYSDGSIETYQSTNAGLAEVARTSVPEIKYMIRTDWGSQYPFKYDTTSHIISGLWADRDFFNMFTFPIIEGKADDPLAGEKSVVITKRTAEKFFPGQSAIGKSFRIDNKYDMTVSAVCADVPMNSSIKFDFILPFDVFYKERPWMKNWGNSSNQSYVMLHENASPREAEKKMDALVKENCKECINQPLLHPYADARLYSKFEDGVVVGGRIEYIRIFSTIAVFILLIACINFMNLSTARSATRSREVGVRKVVGASRKGLVVQFIGESLLLSFAGLFLAVASVELLLPAFNLLTDKNVSLRLGDPLVLSILVGITCFTGFIAGSYPAFFLSSFQPSRVLKSANQTASGGNSLRKVLVVFQFFLSIILIISSLVIYNQIGYIRTKNLGFVRENVITFPLREGIQKSPAAFRNEILAISGVREISLAGHNPFDVQNTTTDPIWPGKREDDQTPFRVMITDDHFVSTLGMTLAEGRNFNGTKADTLNYIINEAAAEVMGMDDPIGQPLEMWFGKGQVIGVIKNFHNQDFRSNIEPLILTYYPSNTWRGFASLEGTNITATVSKIKVICEKYDPSYPFDYSFLDAQFNDQYSMEITTGKLAICFTVIAIVISCLGLFGLASFTAERRTKEIGVRKVMGASVLNLITLLCGDFTRLVLIAMAIGFPVSYYFMNVFLSQYQFHTDLSVWIFAFTGAGIMIIALLTVVFQSARAATTNPVNSLRNE